ISLVRTLKPSTSRRKRKAKKDCSEETDQQNEHRSQTDGIRPASTSQVKKPTSRTNSEVKLMAYAGEHLSGLLVSNRLSVSILTRRTTDRKSNEHPRRAVVRCRAVTVKQTSPNTEVKLMAYAGEHLSGLLVSNRLSVSILTRRTISLVRTVNPSTSRRKRIAKKDCSEETDQQNELRTPKSN
ncbi:unnamed protein product, partial [Aphis gossypii]